LKFFRFDRSAMRTVTAFGSHGVGISPVLRNAQTLHVGCLHFSEHSVLGLHPAKVNQLFLVVSGSGWVRTDSTPPVPVHEGEAVFWEAGEIHESGSKAGMTVIVIEGEHLDPIPFMPKLEEKQPAGHPEA
jgi:quercetin dioxygenase-like cupin family protein